MDIYQIRYFLAVVDAGNFSRAAERVHVTQPTLSTGIKKLEDELGVTLFERNNREVKLTAAGEQFVSRARTISREMEQAKDEMKAARAQAVLRVGALKTLPMDSVAGLVSAFRQAYPEALIELTDGADDEIRARLRLDQIDLAITVLRQEDKPNTSRVFMEEALHLAVRGDHPLARKRAVRLQEFDGQPFIERINCEIWAEVHEEFRRRRVRPQIAYRAENDQSVITLIAAGLGASIMPVRPNAHGVKFVPIEDFSLKRKIGLLWQESSPSKWVELFGEIARDGFR
jgi:DNA-binding transcriptional LysR family regulator